MKLKTFIGGVHPFDGKDFAKDKAIEFMQESSDEVVIPLSQHIGAPARPVVKMKDEVKVGQLIGEAGGFISANIHSSVSGTVKMIEQRRDQTGAYKDCIIIKNDGLYTSCIEPHENDVDSLTNEEILMKVKDAGIVGLGGAGFPTHVKLAPQDPSAIDYVIVNGAECEPYLTSDYRLMLERADELIEGLKIVLKLFPNAKGVIGIEDNKKDAIRHLEKMTKNEPKISVAALKTKYPQGGERSLIYAITKRKIYSKKLPSSVGCIVDNVATIIGVYQAVKFDNPLTTTIMTLTGDAVAQPANLEVRIGTNYQYIMDTHGGFKVQPEKIVSGGPMMGFAMMNLDVPATKTSSSILAFSHDEVADYEESSCIHCGRCVDVCPSRIVPSLMYKSALNTEVEEFGKLGGMECIECGSCSYICPAKRNMTQAFKKMKRLYTASIRK